MATTDVFTKDGAIVAGKKAIRTFAQSLSATLVVFTGILDVDWAASVGAAVLAAALSLLGSVGAETVAVVKPVVPEPVEAGKSVVIENVRVSEPFTAPIAYSAAGGAHRYDNA